MFSLDFIHSSRPYCLYLIVLLSADSRTDVTSIFYCHFKYMSQVSGGLVSSCLDYLPSRAVAYLSTFGCPVLLRFHVSRPYCLYLIAILSAGSRTDITSILDCYFKCISWVVSSSLGCLPSCTIFYRPSAVMFSSDFIRVSRQYCLYLIVIMIAGNRTDDISDMSPSIHLELCHFLLPAIISNSYSSEQLAVLCYFPFKCIKRLALPYLNCHIESSRLLAAIQQFSSVSICRPCIPTTANNH